MTLDGIQTEKENAELLVPIGGSTYIKVKLTTPDKIIIGLGAGVSMEKTLPEAKTIIKDRLADLEKTRNSAQQQFNQVAERINTGRNRMEGLLSGLREGKAPANV
jgi:prefoldin alpha subunit